MDEIRRIRFLIPPVLFVGSLLWGAWCDPHAWAYLSDHLRGGSNSDALIKIITGGGVVVIAGGYIFGMVDKPVRCGCRG